jgi:hypothetical protein
MKDNKINEGEGLNCDEMNCELDKVWLRNNFVLVFDVLCKAVEMVDEDGYYMVYNPLRYQSGKVICVYNTLISEVKE